jgi:hypothetical protein
MITLLDTTHVHLLLRLADEVDVIFFLKSCPLYPGGIRSHVENIIVIYPTWIGSDLFSRQFPLFYFCSLIC